MSQESTSGSGLSAREQAALAEEDSLVASNGADETDTETLESLESETDSVASEQNESTETESETDTETGSEESTETVAATDKADTEETTETESADEPVAGETPEQKAERKSRTAKRIGSLLDTNRVLKTTNAVKDAEIAQLRTKLQAQIQPAATGSQIPKAQLTQTVQQMLAESKEYSEAVTAYNAARSSGDETAQMNAWQSLESEKRAVEFAAFERVQQSRTQHSAQMTDTMDEMLELHRDYPFIVEREGKFDVDQAAPIMVAATQLAASKGKTLNQSNLLLYLNKAARITTATNGVNQVLENKATEAKNRDLQRKTVLENGSRVPGRVTPQAVKRERELIARAKAGDRSARRALGADAVARDFKL